MAGFEVNTNQDLIRTSLWSNQLKTLLLDELFAMKYVRMLDLPSDAGTGTTYNIPSLGQATTRPFVEGERIKYSAFDTGNYTFKVDQYRYSANSISEKFKRDSFYSADVVAAFLPRQHRSIMVDVETRILSVANSGQTASNLNAINGANHRYVASGTNQVITLKDFAQAQYALKVANVPLTGMTAIVDPSLIYTLQTQANLVNFLSPVPKWNAITSNVTPTGMKFEMNIFGFDLYSSNYLPSGITETINSVAVTTNGVANYFFHAANDDTSPWVGAFRQMPTVYSEFNKDAQETEYLTITEYGFQGDFRPENLVTILTDKVQAIA